MNYTNTQRAARVARLLRRYNRHDIAESCLIDLLADARHWCDRHGRCYGQAFRHHLGISPVLAVEALRGRRPRSLTGADARRVPRRLRRGPPQPCSCPGSRR